MVEEIGFNTLHSGNLKVDFSMFEETFWNEILPGFEIGEKKVLDIIDALLISSYEKQDEEIAEANEIYSQIQPGMNKPNMCHGPNANETIWN